MGIAMNHFAGLNQPTRDQKGFEPNRFTPSSQREADLIIWRSNGTKEKRIYLFMSRKEEMLVKL